MIEVDALTFHYPDGTAVFEGFTWQRRPPAKPGRCSGPSGCGKTTLLYLLAGLRLPSLGCACGSAANARCARARAPG